MKIVQIEQAGPPEVFGKNILLTYETSKTIHFVGARFEHEKFGVLHPYVKNPNNIFILVLNVPEGVNIIKYRIVVDGLWSKDPFNPETEADIFGITLSLINIEFKIETPLINPAFLEEGIVKFTFKTNPGKNIYIAGDFNNWDPFFHKLTEYDPGFYMITLRLYPGRHNYYFIVDGEKFLDPYNLTLMTNLEGYYVSSFVMPE